MSRLKVGVCESPPALDPVSNEWGFLCRKVREESPDLFLLNEMPFGPWIAASPEPDETEWRECCRLHEKGVVRLGELSAGAVASSRAVEWEGKRVNQGYLWSGDEGIRGVHTKQYFPDEEGYYEARWFEAGERHFRIAGAGAVNVGFLICTEVMFNEHARGYGRRGAHVILVPRAVGPESLGRWLVAMRMAAVVSGCYVLTSNRSGVDDRGQRFGGCGWIVNPEGDVVAQTSPSTPVVFHEIDTDFVARAKSAYPCYVPE